MNQKDITKLKRLADIADKGLEGVVSELNDLDEKLDETTTTLTQKIDEAINIATETQKMEGKAGYTPIKGKDYFDGQDYVLTEEDKRHIADITLKDIKVPVVEKVIEKVEVIKEPIVKEVVKEIVKEPQIIKETIKEVPKDVLDKVSSLDLTIKELDKIVKNNNFDVRIGVSKTDLDRLDKRVKYIEGVNPLSNITLTYTGNQLTSKSYASGKNITYAYTGNKLTSKTDGTNTWTYGYTGNQLTSIIIT